MPSFPTTLDTFTNPTATDQVSVISHSGQHSDANDAVEALESKIGIDGSAVTTSLDYLIKHTSSKLGAIASLAVTDGNIIVGNGANWVAESGATARTSLGLGTGDSPTFAGLSVNYGDANGTVRFAPSSNTKTSKLYVSSSSSGDGGILFDSNLNILTIFSYSTMIFENGNLLGAAGTERMRIDSAGNVGIGTSTFGANAATVLGIANGTAPAAHVDNSIQIYSVDTADNTATLGLMLEQAVEAIGTFTASHKIKVLINGTAYWIELDAV